MANTTIQSEQIADDAITLAKISDQGTAGQVLKSTGSGVQWGAAAASHNPGANLAFNSGYGIDFSAHLNATGATSEVLSDFEEGSWTPEATSSNIQPVDFNPARSEYYGSYTKIGKRVWLTFSIYVDWQNWRSSGGGAPSAEGDIRIGGFPYPLANAQFTGNSIHQPVMTENVVLRHGSIPSDATLIYFLRLENNSSYGTLVGSREANGRSTSAATPMPPDWKYDVHWGFRVQGSVTYYTT